MRRYDRNIGTDWLGIVSNAGWPRESDRTPSDGRRNLPDYRGAVIILDKRIVTTKYGSVFKRCLPGTAIMAESTDALVERVKGWFGEITT